MCKLIAIYGETRLPGDTNARLTRSAKTTALLVNIMQLLISSWFL
jgi:hypothetical protein